MSTIAPVCGDQDGSETPLVFNCSQFSQVLDRRYYQVPGSGSVSVHFDYVYRDAGCGNSLSVFRVDDTSGSIGGVLPGAAGWPTQVGSRSPQAVFGSGSTASTADVDLSFQGGDILAFLFVGCGTTYYSYEQANPGGVDRLLMFQNVSGQPWQLAWEDGGDSDFNDMIVNVSTAGGGAGGMPPEQSWGTTGDGGINALSPTHSFGDAVNSLTGAFTISETDLETPALGVPFAMTRSYTSADPASGRLGPGWTDSFAASLTVLPNGDVLLRGEDGQHVSYTKQADGSFVGAGGALSTLTAIAGGYKLVRHDQVTYLFNSGGVLQSELDRNNQGLTFSYGGTGQLVGVADATGRTATLAYNGNLLSSVSTADGRTVSYGYTNGFLSSVTLPDPDGNGPLSSPVTRYTYNNGRLESEIDPNNHTVVTNLYDPATGRVTQQTDANQKVTRFAWDGATGTATVTDPDQHVWNDVYQNNTITKEIDPAGDTTQFGYNGGLDTNSVTAPDGTSTTALGYTNHNLTSATAPASLGNAQKLLTYDTQNNVRTITDARNKLTSFGYDAAGNNNSVTLDGQQIAGAVYNAQGEMISSTDGRNKTTNYTYDANGNVASVTDPLGNKTTYTYNAAGLVATRVDPLGNCAGCNPADYTTTYSYDAEGNLLSVSDELAHTTHYVYDAAGNKTSEMDADGNTTSYQYDNANHLVKVTGADPDATGPLEAPVTTYRYDDAGNKVGMVDPLGNCTGCNAAAHTTAYGYNANNQLTSVADPLGDKTTYSYDANGNLASSVDPRGTCTGCNPADYTTTYSYDAAGRLLTTTDPLGHVTTDHYDPTGNRDWTKDANGHQTNFGYDAAGRILTVTAPDPDGPGPLAAPVTTYTYDGNGNLHTRTDDNNHQTIYDYNDDNQLSSVTTPLTEITTYGYDANGNLHTKHDANGNTITYSHDRASRLTGIQYNSPSTPDVGYSYDAAGNRLTMTDGATSAATYVYDNLNRLTSVSRGADVFSYAYDGNDNITGRTYPGASAVTYAYDAANRLANTTGAGALTSFGYDPAGNLTSTVFPSGNGYTETRRYDNAGRLTQIATTRATALTTTQPEAPDGVLEQTGLTGSLSSITDDPDNPDSAWMVATSAGTNTAARVSFPTPPATIAGTQTLKARVRKNGGNSTPTARIDLYENGTLLAAGTNQNVTSKTGQTITQTFNADTLPLSDRSGAAIEARFVGTKAGSGGTTATVDLGALRWTANYIAAPQTLNTFTYVLDAVGNPTQLTTPTAATTYTYDNLDRLTGVCFQTSCPNSSDPYIRWTYDGVGNRLTETRPSGSSTYAYNADDELTASPGFTYGYDANGNQTSASTINTPTQFDYDVANRLIRAGTPPGSGGGCPPQCAGGVNGGAADYTYDGDGDRRSATVEACTPNCSPGSTTNYFWDTNASLPQLALERDGTGATLRRYLNAGRAISMVTSTGTYYLHPDRLNSTRDVTAANGTRQATYDYEPFGANRTATTYTNSAPTVLLRFTGEYSDISTASNLYNLRAREYNTDTNAFLQRDRFEPLTAQPYTATYTYVGNRPTLMVDPSGNTFTPALAANLSAFGATSLAFGEGRYIPLGSEPGEEGIEGGRTGIAAGAWWKIGLVGLAGAFADFCVQTHFNCLPRPREENGNPASLYRTGTPTNPKTWTPRPGEDGVSWWSTPYPRNPAGFAVFEKAKKYLELLTAKLPLRVIVRRDNEPEYYGEHYTLIGSPTDIEKAWIESGAIILRWVKPGTV